MISHAQRFALACLVGSVVVACGEGGRASGGERGTCGKDGTCDEGLSCHSGVCVKVETSPPGPIAESGTASAQGTGDPRPPSADAAREFLEAWLAAQNAGDFAVYSSMYSAEFTGVRRTGAKKRHFDRDGWLVDRKRMFKPSMKVLAGNPTFGVGATHLRILFVQEFSVKGFKDKGRKQLVLVREGPDWRISREDMLESDYRNPNACDPATDFTCTGDGEFYSNEDWDAYSDGEGGGTYVADEIGYRYKRDVGRCRALRGDNAAGKLRGVIVEGGWVRKPKVSGVDAEVATCIEQIAESSWLFADPRENATNDYTPASVSKGFLAFEVKLP